MFGRVNGQFCQVTNGYEKISFCSILGKGFRAKIVHGGQKSVVS
jgi:hypothetical protein